MLRKLKKLSRNLRNARVERMTSAMLKEVSGLIHVGANLGQERYLYAKFDLHVLWIEPIPSVFAQLTDNIREFPKQIALERLITDQDGVEYPFNIASNLGGSSSILDFKDHPDIWPEVKFTETIKIKSTTLSALVYKEDIDLSRYQALIMDTQGSELLVLKGSLPILDAFQFIKVEVPDFESYAGCCQLVDIQQFMRENGFIEQSRLTIARRSSGGRYYDIIYLRTNH